jgi:hypothetical protein
LTLDRLCHRELNERMRSTDPAADPQQVAASPTDPRYWRQRAQESHSLAQQMHNASARGIMLDIALRYEAMAKGSELRLGRIPKAGK